MGRPFLRSLTPPGERARVYCCGQCSSHLTTPSSLMSRQFHARSGRAYLFESVYNVVESEEEARLLSSGHHRVCDVACAGCGNQVGWRYLSCPPTQEFKTHHFCLERHAIRDLVEDDGGGGEAGADELAAEDTDDEEEEAGGAGRPDPAVAQAAVQRISGLAALVGAWGWPAAAVAAATPSGGGAGAGGGR